MLPNDFLGIPLTIFDPGPFGHLGFFMFGREQAVTLVP